MSLVFENAGARLELSPACGAVLSLRGADGAERVVPADEAFTLQLLDRVGVPTRVRSSECAFASSALPDLGCYECQAQTPRNTTILLQ